MKARPILFSTPMVQALLAGRKSQTRRVINPQPVIQGNGFSWDGRLGSFKGMDTANIMPKESKMENYSPYGKVGDLLWVRENWAVGKGYDGVKPRDLPKPSETPIKLHYMADGDKPDWTGVTRPNIFLLQWASRLTLEITDVRVERLQDISEEDAIAEGIVVGEPLPELPKSKGNIYHDGATDPIDGWTRDPREAYRNLWESINGVGSWDENPWVWALTFKVHHQNVDAFMEARAA